MHAWKNDAECFILPPICKVSLTDLSTSQFIYTLDEVLIWSGFMTDSLIAGLFHFQLSNCSKDKQACRKKFGDLQIICKSSFRAGLTRH